MTTLHSTDEPRFDAPALPPLIAPRARRPGFVPGPAWLAPAIAAALALAGIVSGAALMRQPQDRLVDDPRQQARIQVMQEHLATQTGPYVIVAGDSHAEMLNWHRLCGLPVVNLGLSGVAGVHYGKVLARLQPQERAKAAVVFLGTNDIARRLKPETEASQSRFESRFVAVLTDLRRFADRSVYAPLLIRPEDTRSAQWLDAGRAPQFALIASKVCQSLGCRPLDLDGVALDRAEDGVHLDRTNRREGAVLHRLVERELCPTASGSLRPGAARP
jgi:hypothetical protein